MPYPVYKLIHFLGIFTVLAVLVAASVHVLRGGTRSNNPHRKLMGALHGSAVFMILLGGFGMLARLDVMHGGLPGWVYAKLAIWVLVVSALTVVYRGPGAARLVLVALPLIATAAAAIALYKPF